MKLASSLPFLITTLSTLPFHSCFTAITTRSNSMAFTPSSISSKYKRSFIKMMEDDDSPSDYDASDLSSTDKIFTVDENEEDMKIREALKDELLLLSTVTNRGDCASMEERDILTDLVTQLEALNPTSDMFDVSKGEWDLVLSSTYFFRTSPFFMFLRSAIPSKEVALNGFDIHDKATSAGKIGRVRQIITDDEFTSEVDLIVGAMPGLPIVVKGTVISSASLTNVPPETWELQLKKTKVTNSNVPFLDQFLDENPIELAFGDIYSTLTNNNDIPKSTLKTFYADETIRITRDEDDNFFVFSRA